MLWLSITIASHHNRIGDAILIETHNIGFYRESITFYQFNTNTLLSPFYYMLVADFGLLLYGDVSIMFNILKKDGTLRLVF